jgi:hypothetical protein
MYGVTNWSDSRFREIGVGYDVLLLQRVNPIPVAVKERTRSVSMAPEPTEWLPGEIDSHLLVLGLLDEVSVEEREETLHLGVEDLWNVFMSPRYPHRPPNPAHLLLERILNISDHPVELVAHGLGSDTRGGTLEILFSSKPSGKG